MFEHLEGADQLEGLILAQGIGGGVADLTARRLDPRPRHGVGARIGFDSQILADAGQARAEGTLPAPDLQDRPGSQPAHDASNDGPAHCSIRRQRRGR